MQTFETHLAPHGVTTVPKKLRIALGTGAEGARLVWELLPDGALRVTLKHAYAFTQEAARHNRAKIVRPSLRIR